MNTDVKTNLLTRLRETHTATREIIDGVDLETVDVSETSWRIRDILGHVATWDNILAKALMAYKDGSQFVVIQVWDEEEVEFNDRAIQEQSKLSEKELLETWEQAHQAFYDALNELPKEKLSGDYVYPWADEQGDILSLVEIMIDHNEGHFNDIAKTIKESK